MNSHSPAQRPPFSDVQHRIGCSSLAPKPMASPGRPPRTEGAATRDAWRDPALMVAGEIMQEIRTVEVDVQRADAMAVEANARGDESLWIGCEVASDQLYTRLSQLKAALRERGREATRES